MTLEQSAKVLVEEMGECWHILGKCQICNPDDFGKYFHCLKCHCVKVNPDPSSWDFFGKVWEYFSKKELWQEFLQCLEDKATGYHGGVWINGFIPDHFIGPKLITELAEFVEGRKE
jgi:hypothetical protein